MTRRMVLLAVILVIDLAAWGIRSAWAPDAIGVVDPVHLRAEQGGAWTAPLRAEIPWWTHVPNDGAGISNLILIERTAATAQTLAPAHAPPDRVRHAGGGAFNHWGELLFSTSDGSDPRTNGRIYEWRSTTTLHPRLGLVLLLMTGAAVLWSLSGWFAQVPRAGRWMFVGVVFALTVAWNLEARRLYPQWINVDWDTASYLGWSPERTAGYPLLLDALTALTGDLRFLLAVQLNAMLASFALLALAIDRLLRTRVVGLVVFVLLATSPRLMAFPFNVLAEAFFVCGTCVLMALLCEVARWRSEPIADPSRTVPLTEPSRAARMVTLALCGAVLAATELVRPAAFGLAGMVLIPVLWRRGERWRTLLATLLPYALIILCAAWANDRRFGFFATSSMGPVSLMGHVAWNIRPETCPQYPELAGRIEQRLAPILARRPPVLSWPKEYFFWTSDEYNELLWANAMPETQEWVEARLREASVSGAPSGVSSTGPGPERRELMRVRGALARGAMRSDLAAYMRHVGAHVWGFWQSVARPGPVGPALKGRVPRGGESVAALWPQVRDRSFRWMGPAPDVESAATPFDRLSWMERWRAPLDSNPSLLWKIAIVMTLAGLVMAPFSRAMSPSGRLLSLAGTGFQGCAVLAAAVTAVIARYVDAVEPLTIVSCTAAILCIGEAIGRARARRTHRGPPDRSVLT